MPTPQQQINYGNTANDGQGDPLRTAFIKVDDNFDAIWNAGPVGSNITMLNNSVSVVTANGNLVLSANGVGVIQTNSSLAPRFANSYDLGTANLRYRSIAVGSGGASITGNVSAAAVLTDNYLLANGAPFSPGSDYGNANVADFLPTYTGTIAANNVITTNFCVPAANNSGNLGAFTRRWENLWVDTLQGTDTAVAGNLSVAGNLQTGSIVNEFLVNITTNGSTWQFADNILRGPEGGSWTSAADTIYLNSPANGFVNISSLQNDNVVSEIFMEHSFIRFFVDNGLPEKNWQMNLDGSFDVPGDIIPQSNGTASLGNATNYWSNLWVANNTIYIGGVPLGIGAGNVLTVNGEALLSNDSNTSITTTGNITADNLFGNTQGLTGNITNLVSLNFDVENISARGDAGVNIGAGGLNNLVVLETEVLVQNVPLSVTGNVTANFFIGNGSQLTDVSVAPGHLIKNGDSDVTIATADGNVTVSANTATWNFGTDSVLTVPGNTVTSTLYTDNNGYRLNLEGNLNGVVAAKLVLDNDSGFIRLIVGNVSTPAVWAFRDNGKSTFPSGLEISSGPFVPGTDIVQANAKLQLLTTDVDGYTVVGWRETLDPAGNTARIDFNGGGDGRVAIVTGNTDAIPNSWVFDIDGNLTVAGNVNFGGDASAGPSLNDFASITSAANFAVVIDSADSAPTWSFETGDGALGEFDESPLLRTPAGAGSVIYNETQLAMLAGNIDAGERSSVRLEDGGVALLGTSSLGGELSTIIFEVNTGGVGIRALGDAAPRLSVVGNITGGNILTAGSVSANGNITGGNISTAGAVSATGNLTANNVSTGNVTATRVQNDANLEIRSNVAGTVKVWTFDAIGDLNLARNISGAGNINIGNVNLGGFLGDGNITSDGNITVKSGEFSVTFDNTGNITGTSANVTLVAGEFSATFDNTGLLTVPVVKTTAVLYSALPLANAVGAGARAFVTDGNTNVFASTVIGGAGNAVPVYSDGTDWRVG